ncbi:hypothetical protein PHYBLDRAFT_66066 [Phycomyces blakesleeanus NRRL 1555(-)]|uniref:Uncharacterized protein n=1 Tax=Phycomyces blakesleeanus (strain ATCC 8743b / DSM 1359 / FGSC 10004 / NBRC 33097 / NRRL 1555) TaxID=763407 RepID=A0A162PKH4_PHYB8|nr:hypothetical protein PHYBLDRAFT_66066 [Phycomyces blakesleeanus NRRL 1555(-)]OAD69716.1 hypothetical protein PHYBLDRAFT_66066 [Phycomyces blakesleeanus NRRL 1555(-)]|eukprot:XP_018287756.1 hypothetical protein PHYBLDRAFT_66066 [Phycomyces blakesleeanus NRRL 1555(-)]
MHLFSTNDGFTFRKQCTQDTCYIHMENFWVNYLLLLKNTAFEALENASILWDFIVHTLDRLQINLFLFMIFNYKVTIKNVSTSEPKKCMREIMACIQHATAPQ